jgi:hypothetical protein
LELSTATSGSRINSTTLSESGKAQRPHDADFDRLIHQRVATMVLLISRRFRCTAGKRWRNAKSPGEWSS